jgi:hypothetical protein
MNKKKKERKNERKHGFPQVGVKRRKKDFNRV